MKRSAILAVVLCLLGVTIARVAVAQGTAKVNAKGTWEVTISESAKAHAMPAGEFKQVWMLEQSGDKITGKVKDSDMTVTGDMEGLNGDVFRVTLINGDDSWMVHTTIVGDGMSGTIRSYKDKVERLLNAKRTGK